MIDPKSAAFLLGCLKRNPKYKALFDKHRGSLEAWHQELKSGRETYEKARKDWYRAIEEYDFSKPGRGPEDEEGHPAEETERFKEAFKAKMASAPCGSFLYFAGSREYREYLGIEGFTKPPFFVVDADGRRVLDAEEALDFIDPDKSIDGIDEKRRNFVLSRIFDPPGVVVLPWKDPLKDKDGKRWEKDKHDPDYERIRSTLRIDRPVNTTNLQFALANLDDAILSAYQEESIEPPPPRKQVPTIHELLKDSREALAETITELEKIPEPDHPRFGVQPYERILVEDTRKGYGQLLAEYKAHLKDPRKQPRKRKDAKKLLAVWDGRQVKKSFEEIAKELKIEVSTAKYLYSQALVCIKGPQGELERLLKKQEADRRSTRVRTGGLAPKEEDGEREDGERVEDDITVNQSSDYGLPPEGPAAWWPEGRDWELKPERPDRKKPVLRRANPTK